jgi:hypothetical protein
MKERYYAMDTVKNARGWIISRGLYDRFAPGCLREVIAERRLRLQVDHLNYDGFDVSQQNGRLDCREDDQGLWFRARLPQCAITAEIVARLKKEPLRICVGGSDGVGYDESLGTEEYPKRRTTITSANPTEFSLLLTQRSHFPTSWVALAHDSGPRRAEWDDEA